MSDQGDIVRELREDYPAVDVTTVVFSRDFAEIGCCVIPQERVTAIADEIASLRAQLADEQIKWQRECMAKVVAEAQLASARKALEGVYDHMDRNGMANWPVAKRVRKELDSLTDEKGDSK